MGSPWPRYDIHYESPGVPDPPPHSGFRDAHNIGSHFTVYTERESASQHAAENRRALGWRGDVVASLR